MIQELEILITEDNEKHLADARSTSEQYANINFAFARTLEEAESLVEQNRYGAGVIDVFFPAQENGKSTSDSGLSLARKLDEQGIPFVYNTAGNHHGRAYKQFLEESRKFWNEGGFGTGKLIEAYPDPKYPGDVNSEKDTKQWSAAINYALLLGRSQDLSDETREDVGQLVHFAPYGDYGRLSEIFRLILDGTQEELVEELRMYGGTAYRIEKNGLNQDALHFVRNILVEYRR